MSRSRDDLQTGSFEVYAPTSGDRRFGNDKRPHMERKRTADEPMYERRASLPGASHHCRFSAPWLQP